MPKRPSCGNKCRPPVVHLCQQRRFQMPSSFLSVGCHNKKSWLIPMFTGQRAIVVLQPLTHWSQLVFYSVAVLCLESTVNATRCRSLLWHINLLLFDLPFCEPKTRQSFKMLQGVLEQNDHPEFVCVQVSCFFSLCFQPEKSTVPILFFQFPCSEIKTIPQDWSSPPLISFCILWQAGKQISFKSTTNHEQARRKTTTSEILMLIWIYVNSFSATHSAKTAEANIWGSSS